MQWHWTCLAEESEGCAKLFISRCRIACMSTCILYLYSMILHTFAIDLADIVCLFNHHHECCRRPPPFSFRKEIYIFLGIVTTTYPWKNHCHWLHQEIYRHFTKTRIWKLLDRGGGAYGNKYCCYFQNHNQNHIKNSVYCRGNDSSMGGWEKNTSRSSLLTICIWLQLPSTQFELLLRQLRIAAAAKFGC